MESEHPVSENRQSGGRVIKIRNCVATPSLVVVNFDGELDSTLARDLQSYKVGNRPVRHLTFEPTLNAAILAQQDVLSEGSWTRITFGADHAKPDAEYYARVESDVALLRSNHETTIESAEDQTKKKSSLPVWLEFFTPGFWVVVIGLVVLAVLGGFAMAYSGEGDMVPVATAAFGVIGSVVGSFFGFHAGIGASKRSEGAIRDDATATGIAAAIGENSVSTAMNKVDKMRSS